ncbi:DUF2809 domain-containing protein [Paenibacillus sp. FSL H8-0548]|uniref:ribosomal maturation YjgA family protein n=1 Tax=Paenibacillus sp. FSL H8-0548 TaxID=1920422 RepID=UPI0021163E02|nr:DUF2809 domain-containing protein [Paenibacillus sp. FSL H8-0548]
MKARIPYLFAVIIVMLLGYGSRKFADDLPSFVADNAGDALWASMIYFGIRMILVHKGQQLALVISMLFCFGIEASQLYQAEWINAIRSTWLGALVLGRGFLAIDLVRYSVGVLLALLLDVMLFGKRRLGRK